MNSYRNHIPEISISMPKVQDSEKSDAKGRTKMNMSDCLTDKGGSLNPIDQ
jgi:hypothetical protein